MPSAAPYSGGTASSALPSAPYSSGQHYYASVSAAAPYQQQQQPQSAPTQGPQQIRLY